MRINKTAMAAVAAAGIAFSFAMAPQAQAAITLDASNLNCDLLTGCVFNGNDNANSGPDIEAAYNLDHVEGPAPAVLELGEFLGKIDGLEDPSYSWNLNEIPGWDGTSALFMIVKSSTQFKLFQFSSGQTSGAADGFIPTKNGGVKDISHLSFYAGVVNDPCVTNPTAPGCGGGETSVPEPGTWALMIMGFGGAGYMLRRRRTVFA
jgi:hypothetical protein